jgi:ubiquitin-like 1-activating enzyme E1 A
MVSIHRILALPMQAKMAQSTVLYIHVTGVTSEILKNLVLAGIRAVVCDGRPYPQAIKATSCVFFTQADRNGNTTEHEGVSPNKKSKRTVADAIRPKIEELNPLLGDCEIRTEAVSDLTEDFVKQFTIVVASHIGISDAIRLSDIATGAGNKFYMTDCFGYSGASVFDLGAKHSYRPELGKELLDATPLKQHVPLSTALLNVSLADATNRFHKTPPPLWLQYRCLLEYVEQTKQWPTAASASDFSTRIKAWIQETAPSLSESAVVSEESLQALARTATAEIAPVCSVLGGILGNEVIKAISGKGEPANNTILFDGLSCKAFTFLVQPKQ